MTDSNQNPLPPEEGMHIATYRDKAMEEALEILVNALRQLADDAYKSAGNELDVHNVDEEGKRFIDYVKTVEGSLEDSPVQRSKEAAADIYRMAMGLVKIHDIAGAQGLASLLERAAKTLESPESTPFALRLYEKQVFASLLATPELTPVRLPASRGFAAEDYTKIFSQVTDSVRELIHAFKETKITEAEPVTPRQKRNGARVLQAGAFAATLFFGSQMYTSGKQASDARHSMDEAKDEYKAMRLNQSPTVLMVQQMADMREDMRALQKRIDELDDKYFKNQAYTGVSGVLVVLMHLLAASIKKGSRAEVEKKVKELQALMEEDMHARKNPKAEPKDEKTTLVTLPADKEFSRETLIHFLCEMKEVIQLARLHSGLGRGGMELM